MLNLLSLATASEVIMMGKLRVGELKSDHYAITCFYCGVN
jgi:hypothetical protein